MPELTEHATGCPYCGEPITVLIDDSVPEQQFIEDCEVCCRPIEFFVSVDMDGDLTITVKTDSE